MLKRTPPEALQEDQETGIRRMIRTFDHDVPGYVGPVSVVEAAAQSRPEPEDGHTKGERVHAEAACHRHGARLRQSRQLHQMQRASGNIPNDHTGAPRPPRTKRPPAPGGDQK